MGNSKMDHYVEYINNHLLPRINYEQLQKDYQTEEKNYAKSVLNALHNALVKAVGTDYFDRHTLADGFVLLPGVIQSKQNGNLCIALLELDLQSSGEHYGTWFLTKYGCISQENTGLPEEVCQFRRNTYGAYDYGYTATVEGDIHIDKSKLPEEMKKVLAEFGDHEFVACCDPTEVLESILGSENDMER